MAETWILASPEKCGKNGPENEKNGTQMARKWFKIGIRGHFSDFPGYVSPIFQVRPKSIFRPLSPHFGPEARNGSLPGPRDSNQLLAVVELT